MMQPARILLVEDEPELQQLYRELLLAEGFDVVSTADGEQAYDLMLEGGYDLVLLDILLPGLDGLQILERLKQGPQPKKPNAAVVLLTNLTQEDAIAKWSEYGVSGYLMKSDYNPAEFIQQVKQFLSHNE